MSDPGELLIISNPEITSVEAAKIPHTEAHVDWNVGYAPTDFPRENARVVIGTVHAGGDGGFVEVSVAAMMNYAPEREPGEDFRSVLEESTALETLWDIARAAFYGTAGVAGVTISIPEEAPDAEFHLLRRVSEAEGSDDSPSEE